MCLSLQHGTCSSPRGTIIVFLYVCLPSSVEENTKTTTYRELFDASLFATGTQNMRGHELEKLIVVREQKKTETTKPQKKNTRLLLLSFYTTRGSVWPDGRSLVFIRFASPGAPSASSRFFRVHNGLFHRTPLGRGSRDLAESVDCPGRNSEFPSPRFRSAARAATCFSSTSRFHCRLTMAVMGAFPNCTRAS